jgi:glycerol-3-phosphate dehydrogenase
MPRAAVDAGTGMIVRTEKSVLFFIPWGDDRWIVGTTDTDFSGDRSEPVATAQDVDYILNQANRILAKPLTSADVLAVYAGLRPLVAEPDSAPGAAPLDAAEKPTTKLSREHVVDIPLPGLVSIAGGKLTTYRLMARDVIDAAVSDFPREVPPSVTDQLPLLGADGLAAVRAGARRLAEDYGVSVPVVEHLISRYGALAEELLALIRAEKSLGRPLATGYPYLRAEVAYAVTHEGALHVEDVLARRVRLLIESPDAGASAASAVATIMGKLLGWGRRQRTQETQRYLDLAVATSQAIRPPAGMHPAAPAPAEPAPTAGKAAAGKPAAGKSAPAAIPA